MDPRQPPQHGRDRDPFSRNVASPYGRSAFSANTTPTQAQQQQQQPQQQGQHQQQQQQPYAASAHSAPAGPPYSDHQRRPSEPPYYPQPRSYPPETSSHQPQPP